MSSSKNRSSKKSKWAYRSVGLMSVEACNYWLLLQKHSVYCIISLCVSAMPCQLHSFIMCAVCKSSLSANVSYKLLLIVHRCIKFVFFDSVWQVVVICSLFLAFWCLKVMMLFCFCALFLPFPGRCGFFGAFCGFFRSVANVYC